MPSFRPDNKKTTLLLPCLALSFVLGVGGAAATDVELTSTYSPEDHLASIEELKTLSDALVASDFDTGLAAKVEGFTFIKDVGKVTLDGYIFLREDVQGMLTDVEFFGEGRFELRAPIKMERQQTKRFFGTDEIDVTFERSQINFTGIDDQLRVQELEFSAAIAEEARKEHDAADDWVKAIEKRKGREPEGEQEALRRFNSHYTALNLYERLLYPGNEGGLTVNMHLKRPDDVEQGERFMNRVNFSYNPDADEETTVTARFNHGKRWPQSLVCQFATSTEYKGRFKAMGTSPFLEKKDSAPAHLVKNELVLEFEPGQPRDAKMSAVQDIRFLHEKTKMLHVFVTPFMQVKSLKLDGKDWDYIQPKVPGTTNLYARVLSIPLPRIYKKDEHVKLEMELEGSLLQNIDGATYMIKDTDRWYPTPTAGLPLNPTWFDTTIIAPEKFVSTGPGEELDCDPQYVSDGRVCQRFKTSRPIAMATFGLGKGIRVDRGVAPDGTPVSSLSNTQTKMELVYWDPDNPTLRPMRKAYDLSKTGPAMVNKVRASLAIFEEWFGEYPYKKMSLMPNPSGVGRGFPSLLLLWNGAYLSKIDQAQAMPGRMRQPYWVDAFVSHETAHQWWGHVAGIRSGRDQWFSEGFADYASLIYLEAVDQTNKTDWRWQQLEDWHHQLMRDDGYMHDVAPLSQANRFVSAENKEPFNSGGFRQIYMYNKGGFVMHMLRTHARYLAGDDRKGDMLFKKAVRDFLDSCYGGFPSNLDMQLSMKESFGVSMGWFFKQWIHGLGVPKLTFSHEVVKNPEGGFLLRGRVKQRDTKFKFALPVYIHPTGKADRDSPHLYVWISKPDETFEIPLEARPGLVTVNDDLGVLASLKTEDWQTEVAGQ